MESFPVFLPQRHFFLFFLHFAIPVLYNRCRGKKVRILVLGSGAKDHAVAWWLSRSAYISELYMAPGNPGTADIAINLPDTDNSDCDAVYRAVKAYSIDAVFIGTEAPLLAGVREYLAERGVVCFGATKEALKLEDDKAFGRAFTARHGIPTPESYLFTDIKDLEKYLAEKSEEKRYTIKSNAMTPSRVLLSSSDKSSIIAYARLLFSRGPVLLEDYINGINVTATLFLDRNGYLLLPLVLLIYLVSTSQKSIQYAAALSIVACIVVTLFSRETRITPMRLLEALAAGGQGSITVAAACGIAGIIAGTITMTGLANVIINGIVVLAGDSVLIALFLTMICCIVLGMGVPTTATYCIMAATCAPILVRMGVPMVAAHFFVFYFGIVADLTPPVALAAYAGAAIAQANPMKTALQATKLAIGAFIVPYAFALSPSMLLIDTTVLDVVLIVITSLIGIASVSAAMEGYLVGNLNWFRRLLALVGGLMMIYPGTRTDIIGLALSGLVIALCLLDKKKKTALKGEMA